MLDKSDSSDKLVVKNILTNLLFSATSYQKLYKTIFGFFTIVNSSLHYNKMKTKYLLNLSQ